jgi:hypothetical protein
MKRLTTVVLLSAVLGAGPASAMRAHEYLDADQRGPVTLPAHQWADLVLPATPEVQAADDKTQLRTPDSQAAAAPQVPSAVPEPSALAMLACGLLLLLFAPYGRNDDTVVPAPAKRPDSTL